MRISSDILYRLVQGIGTGDSLAARQDVEIPEVLLPTIDALGPTPTAIVASTTDIRRESFLVNAQSTLPASTGATTTDIAMLGRGLWRFALILMHHADFTAVPGNTGGTLRLHDPEANVSSLAQLPNIANVLEIVRVDFSILLPRDSWPLRLLQSGTGVGQTMFSHVADIVSRLT